MPKVGFFILKSGFYQTAGSGLSVQWLHGCDWSRENEVQVPAQPESLDSLDEIRLGFSSVKWKGYCPTSQNSCGQLKLFLIMDIEILCHI